MKQEEFLADVAQSLENAAVPFMVAGSYGSSFHGQPRATNDVDLVIDPTPDQLEKFVASIAVRYYVSPEAAREALRARFMFNIIHFAEGWKADLIVRKDRPYSVEEFQRRKMGTVHGCSMPVASPEDLILTKLEWDKLTPSERQIQDALNVAVMQWATLDQTYLRKWAPTLGVASKLEELLRIASGSPKTT